MTAPIRSSWPNAWPAVPPRDRPRPARHAERREPVDSTTGAGALVNPGGARRRGDLRPRGAILPAYDPLYDSSVRHILVRHEQGPATPPPATQVTGSRVSPYSGLEPQPGHPDRRRPHGLGADGGDRPGAPSRDRLGRLPRGRHPRHHPADHQAQLPGGRPRSCLILAEAFHLASTGRPGPVLVDIPKDVAGGDRLQLAADDGAARLPAHPVRMARSRPRPDAVSAKRPVLYVGGGHQGEGVGGPAAVMELTGAPVTTTPMARGAFLTPTVSTWACCTAPSLRCRRCRRRTSSWRWGPG